MTRQAWVLVLFAAVLPTLQVAGSDKGKVLDRQALARVETYCVDTRALPGDEAYVIEGFLKEQSKSKGQLKDLRWKRFEDCVGSQSDAKVRIEFPFLNALQLERIPGQTRAGVSTLERREYLKAVLRVYDQSSTRMIYTAEALPLESAQSDPVMVGTNLYQQRLDGLRRVFSMLIDDLRRLSPTRAG